MKIKHFLLTAVLATAIFGFGSGVNAQTTDVQALIAQLQAQIQSLLQQIAVLQAQQEGGTTWCHTFNTNLRIGDSGEEAGDLNIALIKEGLLSVTNTGGFENVSSEFSEETASAVVAFQEKYASEVLAPWGLNHGTGFVGKSTRAKLNVLYGCKIESNKPPVINGISGPTTLNVGQTGTWTIQASDPENGTLSYSVIWGDEVVYGAQIQSVAPSAESFTQTVAFTHTYSTAGVYVPLFYVKDNMGNIAKTSISVNVGEVIAPTVSEQVKCVFKGSTSEQKCYTTTDNPSYNYSCSGKETCVVDIKGTKGDKITWKSSCRGYPYTTIDGIDEYAEFTCPIPLPFIAVTSPNGGETWTKGTTQTIKWQDNSPVPSCKIDSTGVVTCPEPTSYDIKLATYYPPCTGAACPKRPYIAPYTIARTVYGSSYNWSVGRVLDNFLELSGPGNTASDGLYTIQICQSNTTICDSSDNYFSIVGSSTTVCTDSDGGLNYAVKGNTVVKKDGIIVPGKDATDYCSDPAALMEYVCTSNNTNAVGYSYVCPYGCENGACKPFNPSASSIKITSPVANSTITSKNFTVSGTCSNYSGPVKLYYYAYNKEETTTNCVSGSWSTNLYLISDARSGSFGLYAEIDSFTQDKITIYFNFPVAADFKNNTEEQLASIASAFAKIAEEIQKLMNK